MEISVAIQPSMGIPKYSRMPTQNSPVDRESVTVGSASLKPTRATHSPTMLVAKEEISLSTKLNTVPIIPGTKRPVRYVS